MGNNIISRIITGSHSAFEEFYDEWDTITFNFFYNRTGSIEDSKDLTQLTFIALWKYRHNLSENIQLKAQLFQKARQVYIDWLRKKVNKREDLNIEFSDEVSLESTQGHSDKILKIKNAVKKLSPKHQQVFELHYFEGFSYREISRILNVPIKTIDSRLYSALKIIKKII